jgi:hypothetical protein
MKLPRRTFLHLAAAGAALPVTSRIARAQTYPTRPVRIVVGFPASVAPDIVARFAGQRLSERLGQQFVIDNRPGAGRDAHGRLSGVGRENRPAVANPVTWVRSRASEQRERLEWHRRAQEHTHCDRRKAKQRD